MVCRWFVQVSIVFGCVAALPFAAAPPAIAAPVDVVRLDGAGNLAMAAGDLVTPEAALVPPGSSESAMVFVPENGASLDIGPIFAEVEFYSGLLEPIVSYTDDAGVVPLGGQSAGSGSLGGGVGGAGSAFPSGAELATGTLDGTVGRGGTGTIEGTVPGTSVISVDGTVPGTSVITINGTLTSPSPIPLPGAAPLFATGVAVLAGWLRRRLVR